MPKHIKLGRWPLLKISADTDTVKFYPHQILDCPSGRLLDSKLHFGIMVAKGCDFMTFKEQWKDFVSHAGGKMLVFMLILEVIAAIGVFSALAQF